MKKQKIKKEIPGRSMEDLIILYRKFGDKGILDDIISESERFISKTVSDIQHKLEKEEARQLAYAGLLVAISRFDPGKKTKFFTYAYYCIRGEILNHIRDNSIIKYPRWIWNLNKIFNDFIREFNRNRSRYPGPAEISEGLNITRESLDEFLQARGSMYGDQSQDQGSMEEELDNSKSHIRSKEYRSFLLPLEDKILLWDAIDRLKSINKKIVVLKFFLGFSQREIGNMLGYSQKQVSRKLNDSLERLRSLVL